MTNSTTSATGTGRRILASIILAGSALAVTAAPAVALPRIEPIKTEVPMFEDEYGNRMSDLEWHSLVMCKLTTTPDDCDHLIPDQLPGR